jgi:hypothetical protein
MMTRFLASGLVATALMLGLQTWRLDRERLAHAETRAEHAAMVAATEAVAREAEQAARLEEQRRLEALQGVIHDTEAKLARARADAVAAADAGGRLRERIASLAASCRSAAGDPATAGPGQATDATAAMLADVQRRLDQATDELARFADDAHAAGLACQRSYGALN